MGKRVFDFIFALLFLIFFTPLFLLVGMAIKMTSSGPVFLRQKRVGKGFRPFYIYKFRTRVKEAPDNGSAIAAGGDTRFTAVGKIIRDLKMDELPQLFNVLKGEMSLVGPRPETPFYVDSHKKDFEMILQIRPGIIDLASIECGKEAALTELDEASYLKSIHSREMKLAKVYVQHQSFSLDLKILFTTLMTLFLSLPFPFSKAKEGKKKSVKEVILEFRMQVILFIHIGAVIASNSAAFWLRFDGEIPSSTFDLFLTVLPIVLVIRLAALYYFGLNQGLWRYAGLRDLLSIGWATLASSITIWGVVALLPWKGYPRSVLLMDGVLLLSILAGLRSLKRIYAILTQTEVGARRVLIIGAGNAGEMVARDMRQNPSYNRMPVAFIDDDAEKKSLKIHNIPVIGNSHELETAIKRVHPDEILIAIPSATPAQMKGIISRCKTVGLPIKTLPNLSAILGGKVLVTDIRNLDIEDLIGRAEIRIHHPDVGGKIKGKRVLVTGAGGSIGSELCRQVAAFQPERLILFERSENNLYQIQMDLLERFPTISLEIILGDILDEEKLEQVFASYWPQMIFHAAAYKHVPMMERSPLEAVHNNIIGTYQVMMAADRHRAEDFVLISTDKAVYPTSIMGATKRVAEMLVQYFSSQSRTKLVSVRFGNVLESSGSVVPLFREQIKRGGPVKVTHPYIKRYFITIQEAVQLVLQAALLGEGGEVFVLDMGEPIKIVDLARTMIVLSGFSPEEDIPIQFIGLRPGEKMLEALFEESEEVVQTRHEKIQLAKGRKVATDLHAYIEKFAAMDHQTDAMNIKAKLKELIPTYCPEETIPIQSTFPSSPLLSQ